jgi:hypothetical protein
MPKNVIEAGDISEAIKLYYRKYRSSTKWWSFCLYSALFGAAALSAAAGVLPQLSSGTKDIATVLAVSATLINTIQGIGRFDQKWQASRTARAAIEKLNISLTQNGNKSDIAKQLEQIIIEQSAGVMGSHAASSTPPEESKQQNNS